MREVPIGLHLDPSSDVGTAPLCREQCLLSSLCMMHGVYGRMHGVYGSMHGVYGSTCLGWSARLGAVRDAVRGGGEGRGRSNQ